MLGHRTRQSATALATSRSGRSPSSQGSGMSWTETCASKWRWRALGESGNPRSRSCLEISRRGTSLPRAEAISCRTAGGRRHAPQLCATWITSATGGCSCRCRSSVDLSTFRAHFACLIREALRAALPERQVCRNLTVCCSDRTAGACLSRHDPTVWPINHFDRLAPQPPPTVSISQTRTR
jgi:hypothetical protein